MRDPHRDKRALVIAVTDLRKQVADLKQAVAERRRVENGLRHARELLRGLLDQAPHPPCLLTSAGSPRLANRAFAELLGHASSGELVRLGGELGLVVGNDSLGNGHGPSQSLEITFRRSDRTSLTALVVSAVVPRTELLAITVLTNQQPA